MNKKVIWERKYENYQFTARQPFIGCDGLAKHLTLREWGGHQHVAIFDANGDELLCVHVTNEGAYIWKPRGYEIDINTKGK